LKGMLIRQPRQIPFSTLDKGSSIFFFISAYLVQM
jgi:hypothetical protein